MIRNPLPGDGKPVPKTLAQQKCDFTAEGAPPAGHASGQVVLAIHESTPGERDELARLALDLDGINSGFAEHERQRSRAPGADLPKVGVSIDDWDVLLGAVTARLRSMVGEARAHPLNGAGNALQVSVLECVDVLDQLHATLRDELGESEHRTVRVFEDDRPATRRS